MSQNDELIQELVHSVINVKVYKKLNRVIFDFLHLYVKSKPVECKSSSKSCFYF